MSPSHSTLPISAATPAGLFPEERQIPPACRLHSLQDQREYLVDGLFRLWQGPQQEVHSPVPIRRGNELYPRLLGRYPLLDRAAALAALAAARRAFDHGRGAWPTCGIPARLEVLQRLRAGLAERRAEVVLLLMWEVGKSLAEAEAEFERTLGYLDETFAELRSRELAGAEVVAREGIAARLGRAPRGVVLCLGPFNYPLNETFATLIPALALGNTAVVKPPRYGVLLFRPLLQLFRELFPPGVVNVVYGEGAEVVTPLLESGGIDVLAFIGSGPVAEELIRAHPRPLRLTTVLGLGAKNAAVVLADADLERAARECLLGSLAFNGQRCTALKILFVQRSRVETFLTLFLQGLKKVRSGLPWEKGVWITPLGEPERPAYLRELLQDALAGGARMLNSDGGRSCAGFFSPTVLYPVTPAMRLYHEEQFGPLVPVVPFDRFEEIEQFLAGSPYGQQISLFGGDTAVLAPLVDALVNQVGRVNLNCKCQRGPDSFPFTGRKESAVGTLSVGDALDAFSQAAIVAGRDGRADRRLLADLAASGRCAFLRGPGSASGLDNNG